MNDLIQWIAFTFALLGSLFTSLKTNRQRKIGFISYLVSNAGWFVAGYLINSIPIMTQSVAFSVFSFLGYWNNRK
jgi:uncharacterized protein with PQ loop repeat